VEQREEHSRPELDDGLDRMQARLGHMPEITTIRRKTVEHPFGAIRAWMGSAHCLIKSLEKVKTGMSLHVLAQDLNWTLGADLLTWHQSGAKI